MGHEGEDMMHVVGIPVEDSHKEDKDKGQEGIHMVADIHHEEEEEGRRGEEMRSKAAAAGSNISPEGAHEARQHSRVRVKRRPESEGVKDEVSRGLSREAVGVHCVGETKETPRAA
ncbi:hypothetical protein B296_00036475 [Ensete ventricosum]|uniref:Uncharacterized protein n=1 Tax=Ensete ventricosum TaxID=4639 RepID=A0A426ZGI5_ENSVE|nr:hypothetical protein B296_00036475 [Ensete ventricosum]